MWLTAPRRTNPTPLKSPEPISSPIPYCNPQQSGGLLQDVGRCLVEVAKLCPQFPRLPPPMLEPLAMPLLPLPLPAKLSVPRPILPAVSLPPPTAAAAPASSAKPRNTRCQCRWRHKRNRQVVRYWPTALHLIDTSERCGSSGILGFRFESVWVQLGPDFLTFNFECRILDLRFRCGMHPRFGGGGGYTLVGSASFMRPRATRHSAPSECQVSS